jgi:uncharacterized spore protein YtfJ
MAWDRCGCASVMSVLVESSEAKVGSGSGRVVTVRVLSSVVIKRARVRLVGAATAQDQMDSVGMATSNPTACSLVVAR